MQSIQRIKWLMTLIIPVSLYFMAPLDVSPNFPLYIGLTSAAIVAWALNVFPAIGVAAMLTFAYLLCGVADAEVVFGPWTTVLPWLSFAAVIIGDAMDKTGLARRVALGCLRSTGGSFWGLAAGFFIGGLILVAILPSILARVVIFCAVAVGIIQALQLDPKSRMSSAIVMMGFFAAAAPQFMFLHSSESFIWAFDMMLKGTGKTVNFWEYSWQATLINVVYYAISMVTIGIVKGKEVLSNGDDITAFIKQQYNEMGPMRSQERKLLCIVGAIILGFMVQPLTNIDPVYIFGVLALLCYLPWMGILKPETFSNLNIVFLVFVTGCMAIGFVGGSVGANKWAVASVVPMLEGWGTTMSILGSYVAGVVINFLLTPLAATAAFTPAFGELGAAMNVNPLPLFYAFNFGLDQYLFPYEAVYFLYIFITERVQLRHIVVALAIRMVLVALFVVLVAVPYWNCIGLV